MKYLKNKIVSSIFSKKLLLVSLLFYLIFKNKSIIIIMKKKIPKISIFLPIYNKENFLKRSISSIQNQNLRDIEIITVNDFSTDNSLKVLKKLASKDNRIKIVNNDRNHGLLYSRAMGILNCTGEYVINLDPDDKFANEKNLESLYKYAKIFKSDLIIYKIKRIYLPNNNNNEIYNYDIKIKQIYHKKNLFKKFKSINLITNKFIKREIILKAYKYFEKKIFSNKWNYGEDNIWSRLILKYSKLKIFFNNIIYIYFKNPLSLMHNFGNELEYKNRISRFELIQEIYKNPYWNGLNSLYKYIKNIIKNNTEIRKKFKYVIFNFLRYYKNKKFQIQFILL